MDNVLESTVSVIFVYTMMSKFNPTGDTVSDSEVPIDRALFGGTLRTLLVGWNQTLFQRPGFFPHFLTLGTCVFINRHIRSTP